MCSCEYFWPLILNDFNENAVNNSKQNKILPEYDRTSFNFTISILQYTKPYYLC